MLHILVKFKNTEFHD